MSIRRDLVKKLVDRQYALVKFDAKIEHTLVYGMGHGSISILRRHIDWCIDWANFKSPSLREDILLASLSRYKSHARGKTILMRQNMKYRARKDQHFEASSL